MIQAPLRLERYFFDNIQLKTRRDFKPGPANSDFEMSNNLEIGQVPEPKGLWRVTLTLAGRAKEGAPPPPYEFELRVLGFFTVAPQPRSTDEETARMVGINGASMLYSASRELLLLLTGRGPWGPTSIPTVSFVDLQIQKQAPAQPVPSQPSYSKGRAPKTDRPSAKGKKR
jgi:preprotein translocase subunit SecB